MEKNTVDMNTLHKYESHIRIFCSSKKTRANEHQIYSRTTDTQKKNIGVNRTGVRDIQNKREKEKKKTDKILNRIPHIFIGIESDRFMW